MASAQDTAFNFLGPEHCIYQFKVKDIQGNEFDFACLEGKKILLVNTGSKCMYRSQLKELQKLFLSYKDSGFMVVAFPSNDFFYREPGSNKKIQKKYQRKFGISFPIMAKTIVRGNNRDPVFEFLSDKRKNGKFDAPPKWNFHKYLIDEYGFIYKSINPSVKDFAGEIQNWILK